MNCLVTRLDSSAVNEFFATFGYQQIYFNSETSVEIAFEGGMCTWEGSEVGAKPFLLHGNAYFMDSGGNNLGKEVVYTGADRTLFAKIHLSGGLVMLEIPNGNNDTKTIIDKMNMSYDFVSDEDVCEFDTSIIPNLFKGSTYCYNQFIVYCDTFVGKLSDIYPTPITSAFNYHFIVAKNMSYEFTGDLSDITFDASMLAWPSVLSLSNLPNISGNLNDFLNRLAIATARTLVADSIPSKSYSVEIRNCPLITYNGQSIGSQLFKNITFYQNGTWSE